MSRALRCGLVGLSLALLPASVAALERAPTRERMSAPLWGSLGRPDLQRARSLVQQARAHSAQAHRMLPSGWEQVCRRGLAAGRGSESHASLRGRMQALHHLARQALRKRAQHDNALARLRRAAELAPDDPGVLLELAVTLASWEDPGPLWGCTARRRDLEALQVLERLAEHHPQHQARLVAHTTGNVLTRLNRFDEAAAAQRRAVAFTLDREAINIDYYNLAELTMLSGNLEDAVVYFRTSMAAGRTPREHLLPLWGLSVTLDRLGEHAEAIVQARKAVAAGGGGLAILRSNDVFFEPDHEIHYYEGLGHEARAEDLAGQPQLEALEAAAESFREFLVGAGEHGPFAADAAENLRGLEARIAAARKALSARR